MTAFPCGVDAPLRTAESNASHKPRWALARPQRRIPYIGRMHRPGRDVLFQVVLWLLGTVPLIVHGLFWQAAVLLLSLGALLNSYFQRQRLGWVLMALSAGLLLLVIPDAPDPLIGAVIYLLFSLGERLSRLLLSRGAVFLLALLLGTLFAWATVASRLVSPLTLLAPTVGFVAVLFSGYGYGTLRRNRDQLRALKDELEAANAALSAQATRDAELSALRERERLARELHDTLGHALSTLTVQQEAARRLLKRDPERASDQLHEAQALTRQAMHDLRAALDDLRSAPAPSLAELVKELTAPLAEASNLRLSTTITETPLSPQSLAALRPVLAEALVNIVRHAQASTVWVKATAEAGWFILTVEDDGVGFDSTQVFEGHYGLRGMTERVRFLDGMLEVVARPGGGSQIELRLPLRTTAQKGRA